MKKVFYLIAGLLLTSLVYSQRDYLNSQTDNYWARIYYIDGYRSITIKNYPKAITDFSLAIKFDPTFIQAYENRGVASYYLERYNDAMTDFNKALEIDPYDYNTYGRRGMVKFKLNDMNGAIDDFSKALEGCSNPVQYYDARGQIRYQMMDYPGAYADFNKAVKTGGGDRAERGTSFFLRGLVEIDLGHRQKGCADLRKAEKLGNGKAAQLVEIYCR